MAEKTTANTTCQISGNGDIYGLGVRLGIYLQWVTSIIVENVYQAEIPGTRAAGNCYQIAMLAGLIRISQYPADEALAIEGYIVLLFCFVGVWASSIGLQDLLRRPRQSVAVSQGMGTGTTAQQTNQQAAGLGSLISIALSAATCAYGTWFLFSGINHMARPDKACNEIIFFFSKVKLFGWVLIILKIFFILSLLGSAFLLIYQLYDITQNFGLLLDEWKQAPIDAARRQSSPSQGQVSVGVFKLLGSVLAMVVFVLSIELTLMWNHIVGVYSCNNFSQVFALVIGASVLVRMVMNLCKTLIVRDMELVMRW